MTLPPFGALRAFEAAARHVSFTRAGEELHVTHAAVSHQMRTLEDWFGTPLFRRDGRGVRLTAAGEQLAARIAPLLSGIVDACGAVKKAHTGASLSVGCIPSIAARWLVPHLGEFSGAHPQADIRVLYAHADEKLASSNLDVLITYGEDDSKDVKTELVFSRVNNPVCSPHFMAKHGPFARPEAIIACDLLHDASREGWTQWMQAAGLKATRPLGGPVYQDFNLLATAVLAGHGIGLCPVNVISAEIRRGDLVVASEIATNDDKGYMIMSRRDGPTIGDEFVRWFVGITRASQVDEGRSKRRRKSLDRS